MNAVIICNGEIRDYSLYKRYFARVDLIICADGGAAHAKRFGVKPHILLGDFDSISAGDLEYFKQQGSEVMEFPAEKDMTDTELAVDIAVRRGSRHIVILGGIGTRLDHSLANILLLRKMWEMGVSGTIADEYNEITLITDRITITREEGVRVSLIPLSDEVKGVTTKGLYYPLYSATIKQGSSWGISNEFSEETAEVTLTEGLLLVVRSREI